MESKKIYPSAAVIMQVYKRDRFTCVYCGVTGADAELQCDHLTPMSKGGSNQMSNLRTSCRKCNQAKGNKTDFKPMYNNSSKMYFFKYKNESGNVWYKTESNLTDETFIVTVVDALCYEYETIFLKIEDKLNIKFYSDFENLLIEYDTESWNEDIKNGTLSDNQRRNHFHMSYLRMLNPNDSDYIDYFKSKL
jgi:hypothetical protein